jgi:hypothetical protein
MAGDHYREYESTAWCDIWLAWASVIGGASTLRLGENDGKDIFIPGRETGWVLVNRCKAVMQDYIAFVKHSRS